MITKILKHLRDRRDDRLQKLVDDQQKRTERMIEISQKNKK